MALTTPATLERREYKYLVEEATIDRIRDAISGACVTDPHAEATGRYLIDTLYLDTPDLAVYRATIEDARDRFKLRIRGYPSAPGAPVFFEVKRRIGDTIVKTRAGVTGDWTRFLEWDDATPFDTLNATQRRAIDNFVCHYHRQPMRPRALVRYEREPYFSLLDEYARVTFDRAISCQEATELSLVPRDRFRAVDDALVLVELKWAGAVPAWMSHMVRTIGLRRESFCKYTSGLEAIGAAAAEDDRAYMRAPARRSAPSSTSRRSRDRRAS